MTVVRVLPATVIVSGLTAFLRFERSKASHHRLESIKRLRYELWLAVPSHKQRLSDSVDESRQFIRRKSGQLGQGLLHLVPFARVRSLTMRSIDSERGTSSDTERAA